MVSTQHPSISPLRVIGLTCFYRNLKQKVFVDFNARVKPIDTNQTNHTSASRVRLVLFLLHSRKSSQQTTGSEQTGKREANVIQRLSS